MKPILLHGNLGLSKLIMDQCFNNHKSKSLFIDCNGKPVLHELQQMKLINDAPTIFLHNYPSSEITDSVLFQFNGKQLVFSTIDHFTPAKVKEFNLYKQSGYYTPKMLINIYTKKLTALININFIPDLKSSHAKVLQDYYNSIIGKADIKLDTYFNNLLKTA